MKLLDKRVSHKFNKKKVQLYVTKFGFGEIINLLLTNNMEKAAWPTSFELNNLTVHNAKVLNFF